MYQEDYYNPVDQNDYDANLDDMLEKTKKQDKGYNVIYRMVTRKDGTRKNKKIEIYTSSGTGSLIRDAETGEYYPYKVGSLNEELYFKVILATGECTSANGSNTLFYFSPQHYENHLKTEVDPVLADNWEKRRDRRLATINSDNDTIEDKVHVKVEENDTLYRSYRSHRSRRFTSRPIDGRSFASILKHSV
jgi:hypothetical protein